MSLLYRIRVQVSGHQAKHMTSTSGAWTSCVLLCLCVVHELCASLRYLLLCRYGDQLAKAEDVEKHKQVSLGA